MWSKTGETLSFCEAEWSETSTIEAFTARDHHERRRARRYDVTTVSLGDLLDRHNAPATIDYLSIDTEGSEFAILEAYDFASGVMSAGAVSPDGQEGIASFVEKRRPDFGPRV